MTPEETPLLKKTLRTTAIMVVPVIALLAILSAVALFAVPSSNATPKEQRVILEGENAGAHGGTARATPRARRDGT